MIRGRLKKMTKIVGRWVGMNSTAVRVLGVVATVLVVATIGMAAARAAQPPDPSEIPVVQTSRPVSDAATDTLDSTFGSSDSSSTIRPQPEPAQTTNSGSSPSLDPSGWGSGSGSDFGVSSSPRGGKIVVPPVRDEDADKDEHEEDKDEHKDEHKDEDKDKSEDDKATEKAKKSDSTAEKKDKKIVPGDETKSAL
jgi:type IV secretory pathway VirB10-like protein